MACPMLLHRDPEVNFSSSSGVFYYSLNLFVSGFLMQSEENKGTEGGDNNEWLKVLVMVKAHWFHATERTLWLIGLRGIKMRPKVTKTMTCERRGVTFRMC
jgi:hypothetical protein